MILTHLLSIVFIFLIRLDYIGSIHLFFRHENTSCPHKHYEKSFILKNNDCEKIIEYKNIILSFNRTNLEIRVSCASLSTATEDQYLVDSECAGDAVLLFGQIQDRFELFFLKSTKVPLHSIEGASDNFLSSISYIHHLSNSTQHPKFYNPQNFLTTHVGERILNVRIPSSEYFLSPIRPFIEFSGEILEPLQTSLKRIHFYYPKRSFLTKKTLALKDLLSKDKTFLGFSTENDTVKDHLEIINRKVYLSNPRQHLLSNRINLFDDETIEITDNLVSCFHIQSDSKFTLNTGTIHVRIDHRSQSKVLFSLNTTCLPIYDLVSSFESTLSLDYKTRDYVEFQRTATTAYYKKISFLLFISKDKTSLAFNVYFHGTDERDQIQPSIYEKDYSTIQHDTVILYKNTPIKKNIYLMIDKDFDGRLETQFQIDSTFSFFSQYFTLNSSYLQLKEAIPFGNNQKSMIRILLLNKSSRNITTILREHLIPIKVGSSGYTPSLFVDVNQLSMPSFNGRQVSATIEHSHPAQESSLRVYSLSSFPANCQLKRAYENNDPAQIQFKSFRFDKNHVELNGIRRKHPTDAPVIDYFSIDCENVLIGLLKISIVTTNDPLPGQYNQMLNTLPTCYMSDDDRGICNLSSIPDPYSSMLNNGCSYESNYQSPLYDYIQVGMQKHIIKLSTRARELLNYLDQLPIIQGIICPSQSNHTRHLIAYQRQIVIAREEAERRPIFQRQSVNLTLYNSPRIGSKILITNLKHWLHNGSESVENNYSCQATKLAIIDSPMNGNSFNDIPCVFEGSNVFIQPHQPTIQTEGQHYQILLTTHTGRRLELLGKTATTITIHTTLINSPREKQTQEGNGLVTRQIKLPTTIYSNEQQIVGYLNENLDKACPSPSRAVINIKAEGSHMRVKGLEKTSSKLLIDVDMSMVMMFGGQRRDGLEHVNLSIKYSCLDNREEAAVLFNINHQILILPKPLLSLVGSSSPPKFVTDLNSKSLIQKLEFEMQQSALPMPKHVQIGSVLAIVEEADESVVTFAIPQNKVKCWNFKNVEQFEVEFAIHSRTGLIVTSSPWLSPGQCSLIVVAKDMSRTPLISTLQVDIRLQHNPNEEARKLTFEKQCIFRNDSSFIINTDWQLIENLMSKTFKIKDFEDLEMLRNLNGLDKLTYILNSSNVQNETIKAPIFDVRGEYLRFAILNKGPRGTLIDPITGVVTIVQSNLDSEIMLEVLCSHIIENLVKPVLIRVAILPDRSYIHREDLIRSIRAQEQSHVLLNVQEVNERGINLTQHLKSHLGLAGEFRVVFKESSYRVSLNPDYLNRQMASTGEIFSPETFDQHFILTENGFIYGKNELLPNERIFINLGIYIVHQMQLKPLNLCLFIHQNSQSFGYNFVFPTLPSSIEKEFLLSSSGAPEDLDVLSVKVDLVNPAIDLTQNPFRANPFFYIHVHPLGGIRITLKPNANLPGTIETTIITKDFQFSQKLIVHVIGTTEAGHLKDSINSDYRFALPKAVLTESKGNILLIDFYDRVRIQMNIGDEQFKMFLQEERYLILSGIKALENDLYKIEILVEKGLERIPVNLTLEFYDESQARDTFPDWITKLTDKDFIELPLGTEVIDILQLPTKASRANSFHVLSGQFSELFTFRGGNRLSCHPLYEEGELTVFINDASTGDYIKVKFLVYSNKSGTPGFSFDEYHALVSEGVESGSSVLFPLDSIGLKGEMPRGSYYRLAPEAGNEFRIDHYTGTIYPNILLDYEKRSRYEINIELVHKQVKSVAKVVVHVERRYMEPLLILTPDELKSGVYMPDALQQVLAENDLFIVDDDKVSCEEGCQANLILSSKNNAILIRQETIKRRLTLEIAPQTPTYNLTSLVDVLRVVAKQDDNLFTFNPLKNEIILNRHLTRKDVVFLYKYAIFFEDAEENLVQIKFSLANSFDPTEDLNEPLVTFDDVNYHLSFSEDEETSSIAAKSKIGTINLLNNYHESGKDYYEFHLEPLNDCTRLQNPFHLADETGDLFLTKRLDHYVCPKLLYALKLIPIANQRLIQITNLTIDVMNVNNQRPYITSSRSAELTFDRAHQVVIKDSDNLTGLRQKITLKPVEDALQESNLAMICFGSGSLKCFIYQVNRSPMAKQTSYLVSVVDGEFNESSTISLAPTNHEVVQVLLPLKIRTDPTSKEDYRVLKANINVHKHEPVYLANLADCDRILDRSDVYIDKEKNVWLLSENLRTDYPITLKCGHDLNYVIELTSIKMLSFDTVINRTEIFDLGGFMMDETFDLESIISTNKNTSMTIETNLSEGPFLTKLVNSLQPVKYRKFASLNNTFKTLYNEFTLNLIHESNDVRKSFILRLYKMKQLNELRFDKQIHLSQSESRKSLTRTLNEYGVFGVSSATYLDSLKPSIIPLFVTIDNSGSLMLKLDTLREVGQTSVEHLCSSKSGKARSRRSLKNIDRRHRSDDLRLERFIFNITYKSLVNTVNYNLPIDISLSREMWQKIRSLEEKQFIGDYEIIQSADAAEERREFQTQLKEILIRSSLFIALPLICLLTVLLCFYKLFLNRLREKKKARQKPSTWLLSGNGEVRNVGDPQIENLIISTNKRSFNHTMNSAKMPLFSTMPHDSNNIKMKNDAIYNANQRNYMYTLSNMNNKSEPVQSTNSYPEDEDYVSMVYAFAETHYSNEAHDSNNSYSTVLREDTSMVQQQQQPFYPQQQYKESTYSNFSGQNQPLINNPVPMEHRPPLPGQTISSIQYPNSAFSFPIASYTQNYAR